MSNPFPELEKDVESIRAGREDVERLLAKMEHDLQHAERSRKDAPDWAIAAAHQAVFDGCVALMAAHGCRPRVNGHHVIALRFARLALPAHAALIRRAERLRRQRHRAMYGTIATASFTDAEAAHALARQLAAILRESALAALARGKAASRGGDKE